MILVNISTTYIFNNVNRPIVKIYKVLFVNALSNFYRDFKFVGIVVCNGEVANKFKYRLVGTSVNDFKPTSYVKIVGFF